MTASAASPEAAQCPGDDDLLAFAAGRLLPGQRRALHDHFDRCEHCQQLLNEAVHALATAPTSGFGEDSELNWSATFRPGTLVGQRYIVQRFIARGGMGEVYEAFDQELQERVALKTVTSTAGDNRAAVRRLKAEVQLARRVSHPNVCRIYDFGTHVGEGAPTPISFLTMEFVDGETLGQRLRRAGALPVDEARRLGRALLSGLQAAHSAGVLHRDFKSENVMLRPEAHGFSPLILDFGLARTFDADAPPSSASHRGLVGTLAYIAPEQFDGKPHTTAGDVYSFGVVWFEMLTGQLPFKPSSSPTVTTLDRLTRPALPPSSFNPIVPPDLDEVVLGCLRRTERERFATAAHVLARLDELERRAKVPASSRAAAIVAALGLMGGAAAFAVLGASHLRPPPRAKAPLAAHSASGLPLLQGLATEAALVLPTVEPGLIGRSEPLPSTAPSSARSVFKAFRDPKPRPAVSITRATAPPPVHSAKPDPEMAPGWENPFKSRADGEAAAPSRVAR